MATQVAQGAERRVPLSRHRVLRAAMGLADEAGVESLTMKRIGQALGVEAMSLYKHVANKDDILGGMVDLVYGEIELPTDGSDWKTAMRQQAISARQALSRHRWAISLMQSQVTPGPANLRYHDSVVRSLREAGFSIEMAIHAFWALDSYIYGFALQELTLPFNTPDELEQVATTIASEFPAEEYPFLAETISEYITKGYDFATEFEFGLDAMLDGLDRALRAPLKRQRACPQGDSNP